MLPLTPEHPLGLAPQRQALAWAAQTPPEVLSRLAADGNLHVRRAAAKHPALPGATLDLLVRAGATPDLMGHRPSDARLSPQDVATLVALGEWGQRLAAQHPDTDSATLTQLAASGSSALRRLVAQHPATEAEVLAELCGDADAEVRMAAAQHPRVPRERVELLRRAGSLADLSGPDDAAVDDDDGGEWSAQVLLAAGVYGRQLAAQHPRIDAERLAELAEDDDWRVRAAVAQNPAADGELLAELADLDTFETRWRIAGHPHTPTAVLEKLTAEPDVRLRIAVAENPNTGPALLRRLALDGASAVRAAVAVHVGFTAADRGQLVVAGSSADLQGFVDPDPTLPGEVLAELAALGGWGQRLAARHPATPAAVLARLMTAGDPMLRDLARRHPACPAWLTDLLVAAGSTPDLQGVQAGDEHLPRELIAKLVELGPWARRLVARHVASAADDLARLAHDDDPAIRVALAKNAATPAAVVDAMASDVSHDVRWALVNRPSASAEALAVLLGDPIPAIRLAAVDHPRTPAAAIELLQFDLDEDVRAAVKARRGKGRSLITR